ncbi:MAG: 3'(2'),5'-bisphosphate nucleotidase CysQ [Acidiferrobacteraceae bacterium]
MSDLVAKRQLTDLLPHVVSLAKNAGAAVMAIYNVGKVAVERKQDASPLTAADLVSHRVIVDGLSNITPDWPILSEESADIPFEQRKGWRCYWLVDPLDGTKEFINRTGEFTVNIALIEDGCPVLGVIYAPVIDRLYYALRGCGAFRETAGKSARIQVCAYTEGKLKVVASRSHPGENLAVFLDIVADYESISMGSSLKFCLVAEGSADLYPRLGPTMEWDTAAAQCIVEQAGGAVLDLSRTCLQYNKRELRNPDFMVTGSPSFPWWDLLDVVGLNGA